MPNLSADIPDDHEENRNHGPQTSGDEPRPRALLPQALAELQQSVEELRVADEEMRVQNEELVLGRQRLEAERQRYQDLFEFAPDGYLVTSLEGTILEANRAASRMVGISQRFLKKRALGTLVALPDLMRFQSHLKSLTAAGEGASGEWMVQLRRRPSGTFPAGITAASFRGHLGQPPTLRWLVRDASERLQAEQERAALALAQAAQAEAELVRRRTEEILSAVTDQFIALDKEWRFVSINASAARLIQSAGKDPETLIGQVVWDVYPTAIGSRLRPTAERAIATGRMEEYEEFSQAWGCWMQVRIFPADNGVSIYANDVTVRHEAETALRAAYDRERRIAETLQEILLHTPPPEAYSSLAIETFYEAASEEATIGGDFSDVFTYDGGTIALVVGDVSGKGLSAATLIAAVKYALRAILREALQPEAALSRLNDFVCEAQRQGDLGSEHLVVLSLAVFQPETGRLSYLTAGGEPLLLLRTDGTAETIGSSGLLLGVQPNVVYSATDDFLVPGDTLLLVTDGLTEARREGELYGFQNLRDQAIQLQSQTSLRSFGQALIDRSRTWSGGKFQDDVCLLLARRLP